MLCAYVGKNGWNGIFFHKANQYIAYDKRRSAPVVQGGQWTVYSGRWTEDGWKWRSIIDRHSFVFQATAHTRPAMDGKLIIKTKR